MAAVFVSPENVNPVRFRPGAPAEVIGALIRATGWPAEVHNTLLKRVEVELVGQGAACV